MSILRTQAPAATYADTNNVVSLAFGGNVTNGHLVVVCVSGYSTSATVPTTSEISTSGTATLGAWTADKGNYVADGACSMRGAIFSAPVTGTGSLTITFTCTGGYLRRHCHRRILGHGREQLEGEHHRDRDGLDHEQRPDGHLHDVGGDPHYRRSRQRSERYRGHHHQREQLHPRFRPCPFDRRRGGHGGVDDVGVADEHRRQLDDNDHVRLGGQRRFLQSGLQLGELAEGRLLVGQPVQRTQSVLEAKGKLDIQAKEA